MLSGARVSLETIQSQNEDNSTLAVTRSFAVCEGEGRFLGTYTSVTCPEKLMSDLGIKIALPFLCHLCKSQRHCSLGRQEDVEYSDVSFLSFNVVLRLLTNPLVNEQYSKVVVLFIRELIK